MKIMYKELFKQSYIFYKLAGQNNQFIKKKLREFFEKEINVVAMINKLDSLSYNSKLLDESFDCMKVMYQDDRPLDDYLDFVESRKLIIEDIVIYFDMCQDNLIKTIDCIGVVDSLSMPLFDINESKLNKNYKNFDYIQNIFYQIYEASVGVGIKFKKCVILQNGQIAPTVSNFIEFSEIINAVFVIIDLFIEFCKIMKFINAHDKWKEIKINLKRWFEDVEKQFKDFVNDPMNDENISSDIAEYLNQQGEYEVDPETGETLEPKILTEFGKEFIKNPNLNDVYEGIF